MFRAGKIFARKKIAPYGKCKTKIRERLAKLENLIDSFSPETEDSKKTVLKELYLEPELILWEYSPKDFYRFHDITKSEARYLVGLLYHCHKKLGDQEIREIETKN